MPIKVVAEVIKHKNGINCNGVGFNLFLFEAVEKSWKKFVAFISDIQNLLEMEAKHEHKIEQKIWRPIKNNAITVPSIYK